MEFIRLEDLKINWNANNVNMTINRDGVWIHNDDYHFKLWWENGSFHFEVSEIRDGLNFDEINLYKTDFSILAYFVNNWFQDSREHGWDDYILSSTYGTFLIQPHSDDKLRISIYGEWVRQ